MRTWWETFRGFWTAEEVPRWFGFSLVVIYLFGVGAVAFVGIENARCEAARSFARHCEYATKTIARQCSTMPAPADERETLGAYQRLLRSGSLLTGPRELRILDSSRVVLASLHSKEIGTTIPLPANAESTSADVVRAAFASPGGQGEDMWFRVRFRANEAMAEAWEAGDDQANATGMVSQRVLGTGPTLYVEGIWPVPALHRSMIEQASVPLIGLSGLLAIFLIHRFLRGQMRSLSRIGSRLQVRSKQAELDLATLRLSDSHDAIATGWNGLVELAQEAMDAAAKTEANRELSKVLQSAGGGALADALHAIPEGILFITEETQIEYANSAACRLIGWNTEEAHGQSLDGPVPEGLGQRLLSNIRSARRPNGLFEARTETVEAPVEVNEGNSIYRMWVIPITRVQGEGECVVLIRDISQQIGAEKAREDFMAQVTHELRTPLTSIRAYAETLSSGMFEDPKVVADCYNVITKETRRLSRLVEDMLSASQLEVGSIELAPTSVDLKTLLSDTVRDVRSIADEKEIDIQLLLPAKMENVNGDSDKLAVVINNLLGNAVKYTPNGGTVIVGCQVAASSVTVTFKDNGIGIDPSDHARIFEKFQRGRDPDVKEETGTGIGLYTAREIVRRHGGDIELISEKGQGSTFMVRLPHEQGRSASLNDKA